MKDFLRFSSLIFFFIVISTLFNRFDASRPTHSVNNQRSADRDYKYAWFTRSIDENDDEILKNQLRQEILASIFARRFGSNRKNFDIRND